MGKFWNGENLAKFGYCLVFLGICDYFNFTVLKRLNMAVSGLNCYFC